MHGLRGGLLVDDAMKTLADRVAIRRVLGRLVDDRGLVVDDRALARPRLDALEQVRPPDGAIVRDAAVGVHHLETGDEKVALADGEVAVVAALPGARLVRGAREVVPLPLRVRNSTAHLAREIDARGAPQAVTPERLLHALLGVGVVEALADRVEDDVAGVRDARHEGHGAVTALIPAVPSARRVVLVARPSPVPGAVPARGRVGDAVVERGERRERLDRRPGRILAGDGTVHERVVGRLGGEGVPVGRRDASDEHVWVVGRCARHGEHLAVGTVHADDAGARRVVSALLDLLHPRGERLLGRRLDGGIDRQNDVGATLGVDGRARVEDVPVRVDVDGLLALHALEDALVLALDARLPHDVARLVGDTRGLGIVGL